MVDGGAEGGAWPLGLGGDCVVLVRFRPNTVRTPLITSDLLAQGREGVRDPLALAVLDLLKQALLARRVPAQEVDDLCQHKAPRIVEVLLAGRAEPGKEDAYVWRCGETTAFSYFRQRGQRFTELDEDTAHLQEKEDDAQEQEVHRQRQVDELRRVLEGEELPGDERELLHRVYTLQLPIEQLAKEELTRNPTFLRGARVGAPRTLAEARNSVDQRLTRARKRLGEILKRRVS
jgi:DNA-directed RNA polymerase specialized sigma24 family protein